MQEYSQSSWRGTQSQHHDAIYDLRIDLCIAITHTCRSGCFHLFDTLETNHLSNLRRTLHACVVLLSALATYVRVCQKLCFLSLILLFHSSSAQKQASICSLSLFTIDLRLFTRYQHFIYSSDAKLCTNFPFYTPCPSYI